MDSPESIRLFYYDLSDILRHFIEDIYGINAPELTSEEFLDRLRKEESLEKAHQTLLRDFLEGADLVKYARYTPEEEVVNGSFETVSRFVEETREMILRRSQTKGEGQS